MRFVKLIRLGLLVSLTLFCCMPKLLFQREKILEIGVGAGHLNADPEAGGFPLFEKNNLNADP